MKPKRLELCGINSFSRKASIDFQKLLSGGIFGIFGDTGSGKTTILDSIVFSLYGKIDRLRGGTGSEIINYNSDKASVMFEFEIETTQGRKTYRVEREIKRKNSVQAVTLSEVKDDRITVVSDGVKSTNVRIQEIIGLSFEDFKKCIALPQGEFAQFVKSERAERLKLIARLFDLERYGERLNARLKERLSKAQTNFDLAEGELRGYIEITEETFAQMRSESLELKNKKLELDEEFNRFSEAFEKTKIVFERAKKYRQYQEEREQLKSIEKDIQIKKEYLKLLPSAIDLISAEQKIVELNKKLDCEQQSLNSRRQLHSETEKVLFSLQNDAQQNDFARIIFEQDTLLAKLAYAKSDLALMKDTEKEIVESDSRCTSTKKRKQKLESELKELSIKAKNVLFAIEETVSTDLEKQLLESFDGYLLRKEYLRAKKYFEEKREELHRGFQGGELFEKVENEIDLQIKYFTSLLTSSKAADVSDILGKYREEQVKREKLNSELKKIELLTERNNSDLKQISDYLNDFEVQNQRLLTKLNDIKNKLQQEFHCGDDFDFAAMEISAKAKKRHAEAEQEKIKTEIEAKKNLLQETKILIGREEVLIEKLKEELNAEDQTRNQLLKIFSDSEMARKIINSVSNAEALQKQVDEFDKRMIFLQSNIEALEKEGASLEFSEKDYLNEYEKMNLLTEKKQFVTTHLAMFEKDIASFAEKLARKKELELKRSIYKKQLDLLFQLRQLLKGNGLMEFIAEEYLADISLSATKTLLRLTNGRYFIRYKDGGFQIGDNFCGGEFRSVNTLSGGEIFLVSLSLALSLSEAIHAKSLRPIEFFFLDEGFGTLDEKLVDTVIDSLEKLKSDHFSIGLISHVEELKHRINNKIIVTGAQTTGSSEIQICY